MSEQRSIEIVLERRGLLHVARECALMQSVDIEEIFETSRLRPIVRARSLFCAVLRGRGWSFPAIARLMQLDHTTVLAAIRRVSDEDVIAVERSAGRVRFLDDLQAMRL